MGDHLIAQKGDQRTQESTEEGGMEGHVAKSSIGSHRLVTLGGPGRYKCPVYKENVCFLERPDGEQLSMQGCMIARKVVVFNLNEKTCMICMVLMGPGEALGGTIAFYTANAAPAEGQN